jgi:hypothetical protein
MAEIRHEYKILVRKREGKRPLNEVLADGGQHTR